MARTSSSAPRAGVRRRASRAEAGRELTRLEQDHWNLARGALAIAPPIRILLDRFRPDLPPLILGGLMRMNLEPPPSDLHLDVWMCAQVVQPRRILRKPSFCSHDHQVLAVAHEH